MRTLRLPLLLLAGLAGLAACEQEGPLEEAGEEVDEAIEEAGDAVEDAAE